VDGGGVALAAIQGLNQKVEKQGAALEARNAEINALKAKNDALEKRLEALERLLPLKPRRLAAGTGPIAEIKLFVKRKTATVMRR
jgi:hypothetical protein